MNNSQVRAAEKHAEARYADQLARTVAQMLNASEFKAVKLGDWINEHLDRFATLQRMRADVVLENPASEDEQT